MIIIPRADNAIHPQMLSSYEKQGWWAQVKMNGTYSVLTVDDGKVVDTMNRHREPHKTWRLTEASARVWSRSPKGRHVYCAELLHSKVVGLRDTH